MYWVSCFSSAEYCYCTAHVGQIEERNHVLLACAKGHEWEGRGHCTERSGTGG